MSLLIWAGLLVYVTGAALQDLHTREISNFWNLIWGIAFVAYHVWTHTWETFALGALVMGVVMLLPSVKGIWGVGDWKMSIVMGTAVSFIPALIIWFLGFLTAPILKHIFYKWSISHMEPAQAKTIPVASLMLLPTLAIGVTMFEMAIGGV